MPIYEYKCTKCGKEFEVLQRSFDVDEAPCEDCGAPGKRFMSNTSFVLKGTGWYVTDYKANGGCSASGNAANGSNGSSKPAEAPAAEAAAPASPCASGGCSSCPSASASSSDA
ncbi:MAG: putative regulatory protein, FmdB family [Solidesulfovibrio magneticus str. Maddingley MBC34]|jgi:putative FmdB family regulatory protein|uniref:Putative regulatory protein, FmdB family n=1 Tax=Solidesulfovibrio magneticus str. Maddingley MBC34 TaxID=1206767 RepID=K6FP68_9BACT|nr:MAG: putative regulatory protein, FmdB family [Solidesulfovibrio magneticus str. Maddingley MBC34]HML54129.1 zinc ribbon domain-containing protein [Solidesulfovibrio magneticus]